MTRKLKSLNVLAIALIAGFIFGITSLEIRANILTESPVMVINITDTESQESLMNNEYDFNGKCGEGKCGEGKCGSATKESKKDVKSEKKEGKVKSSESKYGEGKCGAEKKEGKAEKKEGKTEKKSKGKCGEGKCGVA